MVDIEANDAWAEHWTAVKAIVYIPVLDKIAYSFTGYARAAQPPTGTQVSFWQKHNKAFHYIQNRAKETPQKIGKDFVTWLERVLKHYPLIRFVGDNLAYEIGWIDRMRRHHGIACPLQAHNVKYYMRPIDLYGAMERLPSPYYEVRTQTSETLIAESPRHTPAHDLGLQIRLLITCLKYQTILV